jgi:hypothetical protein
MLPDAEGLSRGIEFLARRQGRVIQLDTSAVADLIAHARRLAHDDEHAEPAALFYAGAVRPRAYWPVAQMAMPFVAMAQAHRIGLRLDAKDIELDILRARILYGAMEFEELRAWFASRLRPLVP